MNIPQDQKTILIRNATVIDPSNELNQQIDVLIKGGRFAQIGAIKPPSKEVQVIDAKGLFLIPGLVDLRARFREPGQEYKATIASEARAAALAGITTVCIPPDTDPMMDRPSVVNTLFDKSRQANAAKVYPVSALTNKLKGKTIADIWTLAGTGCVGASNAKNPIPSVLVLRRAMQYAASFDITVHLYPQDHELYGNGCVHEGVTSTRLGLSAVPPAAELVGLARDIALVETTNVSAHFMGLSCARSVEMIAEAQQRGLPITADVDIHHLLLSEEDMRDFDSNFHLQPPLRTTADKKALLDGIRSGIITAICSDHQPHNTDAKLAPFAETEPGISSLERLLPGIFDIARNEDIPLESLLLAVTKKPADIMKIDAGTIAIDKPADCVLIDPDKNWSMTKDDIQSQGKNSPYLHQSMSVKAVKTFIDGQLIQPN